MDKALTFCILLAFSVNSFAANFFDVEKQALKEAPDLKVLKNKVLAFENQAVAKSQWRDPTIELGAQNFPTDTFNINQEPMTQLRLGLKQVLPRGDVLRLNHKAENIKAEMAKEDFNKRKLEILKYVREIWVKRYYWRQVRWILLKKRATFVHLQEVANAMYASNKAPQKSVLNAKLQISKVDERIINATRNYQSTTDDLARWVGMSMASKSHPHQLPRFTKLPTIKKLEIELKKHPLLVKGQRKIILSKIKVDIAQQSYKPALAVGLSYAHRDGLNMNRSKRADFISAGISIELPIFPKNRQDKRFRASELNLKATQYNYHSNYLSLKKVLNNSYVSWLSTGDELYLYKSRLIPEATSYAESTLIVYQNNKTDFPTLAQSYIELYNLQLKQEKARLAHTKRKIHLLYLQGK